VSILIRAEGRELSIELGSGFFFPGLLTTCQVLSTPGPVGLLIDIKHGALVPIPLPLRHRCNPVETQYSTSFRIPSFCFWIRKILPLPPGRVHPPCKLKREQSPSFLTPPLPPFSFLPVSLLSDHCPPFFFAPGTDSKPHHRVHWPSDVFFPHFWTLIRLLLNPLPHAWSGFPCPRWHFFFVSASWPPFVVPLRVLNFEAFFFLSLSLMSRPSPRSYPSLALDTRCCRFFLFAAVHVSLGGQINYTCLAPLCHPL